MKSSVRRPLRHRASASVALALLASVAAADAPRPQLMNDPLFGLSYDTAQVQFEPSASHGPPKGQRWLLARVRKKMSTGARRSSGRVISVTLSSPSCIRKLVFGVST